MSLPDTETVSNRQHAYANRQQAYANTPVISVPICVIGKRRNYSRIDIARVITASAGAFFIAPAGILTLVAQALPNAGGTLLNTLRPLGPDGGAALLVGGFLVTYLARFSGNSAINR